MVRSGKELEMKAAKKAAEEAVPTEKEVSGSLSDVEARLSALRKRGPEHVAFSDTAVKLGRHREDEYPWGSWGWQIWHAPRICLRGSGPLGEERGRGDPERHSFGSKEEEEAGEDKNHARDPDESSKGADCSGGSKREEEEKQKQVEVEETEEKEETQLRVGQQQQFEPGQLFERGLYDGSAEEEVPEGAGFGVPAIGTTSHRTVVGRRRHRRGVRSSWPEGPTPQDGDLLSVDSEAPLGYEKPGCQRTGDAGEKSRPSEGWSPARARGRTVGSFAGSGHVYATRLGHGSTPRSVLQRGHRQRAGPCPTQRTETRQAGRESRRKRILAEVARIVRRRLVFRRQGKVARKGGERQRKERKRQRKGRKRRMEHLGPRPRRQRNGEREEGRGRDVSSLPGAPVSALEDETVVEPGVAEQGTLNLLPCAVVPALGAEEVREKCLHENTRNFEPAPVRGGSSAGSGRGERGGQKCLHENTSASARWHTVRYRSARRADDP